MANRVLIGDRSTGGYGCYISKNGEDVLTTTNSLIFDSRMGASAIVHSYAQGTLVGEASTNITHNLGYNPLYALRWTDSGDISGGVATKAYSPNSAESYAEEYEEEGEEEELVWEASELWGCDAEHLNTNSIRITGYSSNDQGTTVRTVYYAIVIFHEADYTGGQGL